jgi:hypothetical protein
MYQLADSVHSFFFGPLGQEPAPDPEPSVREIAAAVGVAPSTISRRWKEIVRAMQLWSIAEDPPRSWKEPDIARNGDYPAKFW